jgi:hypothetical protein
MSTTNSSCTTASTAWIYGLNPGGIGSTVVPFSPGLIVPPNRALCAINPDTTNQGFDVYGYGYLIAASASPAGHAVTGSQAPHVQR